MVNYSDPMIIELELLAFVKLGHLIAGIYIWEYITNLTFEYTLLWKAKRVTIPAVVYAVGRFTSLVVIILYLVYFNITTELNCSALYKSMQAISYFAVGCFSYLIITRTIAIWGQHMYIKLVTWPLFLGNVAVLIYGVVCGPTATWLKAEALCSVSHSENSRHELTTTLAIHVTLLALMMAGVARNRGEGSLWKIIFTQGVVWIFVVIVFNIPPEVLIYLNLNTPMNDMLQPTLFVATAICTTRMYRGLYEFAHSNRVEVDSSQKPAFAQPSIMYSANGFQLESFRPSHSTVYEPKAAQGSYGDPFGRTSRGSAV